MGMSICTIQNWSIDETKLDWFQWPNFEFVELEVCAIGPHSTLGDINAY